mgnify:CR=1 FL=1
MSDKELIQELRKMLKLSQEDRGFLESCYEGAYVFNGKNFDDTFEACVRMGTIDTKVEMLEFLKHWETKPCDCPQDLISALRDAFDFAEDGELTDEFDITEDGEPQEGAIYVGTGDCTCCVCNGENSDDAFEVGVEIGSIEAKVGMLHFLKQWELMNG